MTRGNTDVPPGAGCTLKHHSLDPYGGHEMVQQHLMRCCGWKHHQFWLGFAAHLSKLFSTTVENRVWGDTDVPPGAGCTLKHHSHWIHIMEDMKWFSSI
jgi:hypothetical protein